MKILIINGPNINLLGKREKEIYGTRTYNDLLRAIDACCKMNNVTYEVYQSNHEGDIIDKIQECTTSAIIINAGAYTHTSIAIYDALRACSVPVIEVHLTNPKEREEFRRISYIEKLALKSFVGEGIESYLQAIRYLAECGQKDGCKDK